MGTKMRYDKMRHQQKGQKPKEIFKKGYRKFNKKGPQDVVVKALGDHLPYLARLDKKECAESLLRWYYENGFWTDKQLKFAKSLVHKAEYDKKMQGKIEEMGFQVRDPNPYYYIYAIYSAGSVKIGYSRDPKNRVNELKTGSPNEMVIAWHKQVANREEDVRACEKELHTYFKNLHLHGEWFGSEVLNHISKYSAKWNGVEWYNPQFRKTIKGEGNEM